MLSRAGPRGDRDAVEKQHDLGAFAQHRDAADEASA